jgi:hypothetical protein
MNGSYEYISDSSEAGYVTIQSTNKFNVNGTDKSINIDFVGVGGKVKVNNLWMYLILGAVGLVAILLLLVHRRKFQIFGVRGK